MLRLGKGKNIFRRYRDGEDGNVALMFAVSAVTVVGCMGAAMDYSTLSNAASRSQAVADQTALAAAVYVKDNGAPPLPTVGSDGTVGENPSSNSGYLDKAFKTYSAAELGYEYKGWVTGGAENVTVELEYDDINREVTTTVSGTTTPTFIQLLGKHDLAFKAVSTAKYQEMDFYDPASVVMVLDNSGSMAFDDKPKYWDHGTGDWEDQDDVMPRITALKTQATSFIDTLYGLVGDQSQDKNKVLRTGMMAYEASIISGRTVSMRWNTSSVRSSLQSMIADGGTNSAPPIDTARSWMSTEDQTHLDMHGKDPLKFMIFMTDGVNTSGGTTWVEEEGTGQWYGLRCSRYKRGSCRGYSWDTVESEEEPDEGYYWEEGKWEPTANISSITDCTAMKNDGVKIYTIGFALSEGWYDTNEYYGYTTDTYLNPDIRNQAYSFLASCASTPDSFLTAENADELQEAFSRIGAEIQTEIIRLSN